MVEQIPTSKSRILRLIHDSGPLSRAELSRALSLSSSVVSSATKELLNLGILKETVPRSKALGRPGVLLDLVPEFGYVIGTKLTGGASELILVDMRGRSVANVTDVDNVSTEPGRIVESLANQTEKLVTTAGISRERLLAVGIGIAGIIDRNTGVCKQSTVLGWEEVPFRDMLQERLRLPVFVDNDANTLAVSQSLFGDLAHYSDAVVITIGRGIGAGILYRGHLYTGALGGAGEVGHCIVDPEGPVCQCGKRGCLEAVASVPAMVAEAQAALPTRPADTEQLLSEARVGNKAAMAVLERAGKAIGVAVSHVINLLNPQAVLITSCDIDLSLLEEGITQSLRLAVVPYLLSHTEVKVKYLRPQAWTLGAASIAISELIQDYSLLERGRAARRHRFGER